mgnify:CR=1 FL=1
MTKDVLINISGLQVDVNEMENNDEPIETISTGNYFFKNGKHYLLFEEVSEGVPGVTKTQIKIKGEDSLEVLKRGVSNAHMIFDTKRKNRSYYETPYGQLNLGIFTRNIKIDEKEDNINIKVEYALDVNYEPLAECTIRINVKPKVKRVFYIRTDEILKGTAHAVPFKCYFLNLAKSPFFFLTGVSRGPLSPFTPVM